MTHQMTLDDAALWQAACATMPAEKRERLAALHEMQQRRRLSDVERSEEQALLQLHREIVLARARAAILLQGRGYDITDLSQFNPRR
jgi:hypothetical protein